MSRSSRDEGYWFLIPPVCVFVGTFFYVWYCCEHSSHRAVNRKQVVMMPFNSGDEVQLKLESDLSRSRKISPRIVFFVVECIETKLRSHLAPGQSPYFVRVKHAFPGLAGNTPALIPPMEFVSADDFRLYEKSPEVVQLVPLTRQETIRYVSDVTLNSTTCKLKVTHKEIVVSAIVQ